jgi:hypothetical protein
MAYTVPMPPSRKEVNEEAHRKYVKKAQEEYMRKNKPKQKPQKQKPQVAY